MTAPGIVPALDEVEDRVARLCLGAEPMAIEQLALEGREEALAERVVVRVPHASQRRPDAGLPTPATEGDRRVLGALVRVMNEVAGPALRHGHVERGQDQLRPEMP